MEKEKELRLMTSFLTFLDNKSFIIEMKKRIEVGNLEYNVKIIQKELERSIQENPDDRITQYKQIWLAYNYYIKDDDSLKRIRTVNNLIIDDLPMGKELIARGRSQKSINEFYVENGIYTTKELIEINDIESLTESKAIKREKLILEKLDKEFSIKDKSIIEKLDEEFSIKDESNKKKHSFPLIDLEKYDSDKIYTQFFNGELAVCTKECFTDWFVKGYEANEIVITLRGRKGSRTGKETIPIALIRKFFETITGNTENIKDAYFKKVFKLELNNINTAKNLNLKYEDMLKVCEF